jgi:uncharacterized protein YdaU (DUF1376 family)
MARSEIGKWMPFDIDRFFGSPSVQQMKDFQKWWYTSLLLRAWQAEPPCRLPDDQNKLMILAGVTNESSWKKHSAVVLGMFEADGNGYRVNATQLEIYEEKMAVREVNKANGKLGGRPRKTETKPKDNRTVSDASSSDSSSEDFVFELPIWVPEIAWAAFVESRKKLGKTMSEKAKQLAVARLKDVCDLGLNPEEVIYESVLQGWPSFYPPRDMPKHSTATVGMDRE